MPVRPCPKCQNPSPRWLEEASKKTHVNYYRCEKCGHVCAVPKADPDAPPITVAEGKDRD
jgi:hypothetical protein